MSAHEDDVAEAREPCWGRPLPLNSKKLTRALLEQLAKGLEVPSASSPDEMRQLIDAKLEELGREPRNVQVLLMEDTYGTRVGLQDAEGVFIEVEPEDLSRRTPITNTSEAGGGAQVLREELEEAKAQQEALQSEVTSLQEALRGEKERVKELWRVNCTQLSEFDTALTEKDEEIARLKEQLERARADSRPRSPRSSPMLRDRESSDKEDHPAVQSVTRRRGRAPPVDSFTGERPELRLDDWLPALQRASQWNGWGQEELLIQLAGHLRGRALQEWNLLAATEKTTYSKAVEALRGRLDPGGRVMAAQDFRHTSQADGESVSDFIRRLERTFQLAYGRDGMQPETRDALLYGQLQEGLHHHIMEGPAVSGAVDYQALCVAAKNEERRQSELRKRRQYQKATSSYRPSRREEDERQSKQSDSRGSRPRPTDTHSSKGTTTPATKRCYHCDRSGHLLRDCPRRNVGSSGKPPGNPKPGFAKQVQTTEGRNTSETTNPLDFLYSSSEDESEVRQVRVTDKGSRSQCARVHIQGVPAYGVIDSGADITIIGGSLFRRVASVARLRKRDFRKPDKTPRTYDQKPFTLDGRMDLDVTFGDVTMRTPVYIKTDAPDQLLLSEGVCRQLGIISYHKDVQEWRGRDKDTSAREEAGATVPAVRVSLVSSVQIPPRHSTIVEVAVDTCRGSHPVYLERDPKLEEETGLWAVDSLLLPNEQGVAKMVISNPLAYPQMLGIGTHVGEAHAVVTVEHAMSEQGVQSSSDPVDLKELEESFAVRKVDTYEDAIRRQKLLNMLSPPELLDSAQTQRLLDFLADHNQAFCVDPGERGETDLLQMHIDTDGASPVRQPPRRMPFAVRQEVARQLRVMQETGVIQPSSSPWASPVVMVKKRDGSHRFCVDYRGLNAVTKADRFPLPRIDDLLDQLGKSKFFSTLDLASGYWQIRLHPDSQEKTAFVTPQGLYEFRVMPFGLTNAPSVFQRLMQRALKGLNPEAGPDFVEVYIDDVLIFSQTLEEHLDHLAKVIGRLQEVGLKLKPTKCQFIRQEVEYLGHVIMPEGLKPNTRLVQAVEEFPTPRNVKELRRFLGMSSYYRRFVPKFASIAHPLHRLTRKEVDFVWSDECASAFSTLKRKLVTAPVLAYPSFEKEFVLETDASVLGIGAILSQRQEDGLLHPVAYASRALSPQEANYSITELETLAVVWAITYFHTHLYGQSVTVFTDHAAVRAVLETPNPTGKYARWWTRVYGKGVKEVKIVHRPGKSNLPADALSRSPQAPAPREGIGQLDVQVAVVDSRETTVEDLLQAEPERNMQSCSASFPQEQRKDPGVRELIDFLEKGELPADEGQARKVALQGPLFTVVDGMLFFLDPKRRGEQRAVVPRQLRREIMEETHRGPLGAHFSGKRLYSTLARHWWWEGMFADATHYVKNCPECAVVSGGGKVVKPPLHPIPVDRPFQIVGVDIMDLPATTRGNKHVLVFQDFLTKWPLVFPIPDQKSQRIAEILVQEVIPLFGVPESLLSDRGTNLLSHLMMDVCDLLGIAKLNTTAYHPQCNGLVERFNRTLKTALRKHAARFGTQWDQYLSGVLWAYRNTPHDSTGEKPSYLLFGVDLRTPTEAALLPPTPIQPTEVDDYREELTLSLSSGRELAVQSLRKAQKKYKSHYDRSTTSREYRVGDWVLVRFPHVETGRMRKLSQPWHGPFRVVSCIQPDVTVVKVYLPQDGQIQVHQTRVTPCPEDIPAGYYWYGCNKRSPGRPPPRWVSVLAQAEQNHGLHASRGANASDELGSPSLEGSSDPLSQDEPIAHSLPVDAVESEEEGVESDADNDKTEPESTRNGTGRYALRKRVNPPQRLQLISARDELP